MARSTELSESLAVTDLLADLPVTRESTTSRVVVNNPALRVVVFAFDEGELLTAHSSPRAVVVHLLDGAIRFTVGDEEHRMTPGDVIYLAPGERHALVADRPSHLSLVMVDTEAGHTEARHTGAGDTAAGDTRAGDTGAGDTSA